MSYRELHSLFILTFHFTKYPAGPTSLGESNNPNTPQLWKIWPSNQQGGLTSMNLHDLITLMILPIGTSGTNEKQHIKYTSEYILNLQIHQHF